MSEPIQELPDSILEDDDDLSVIREEYISTGQLTQQQGWFMPQLQQSSETYQPLAGSQSSHYINESLDIHGNVVYQQFHGTNSQRINSFQGIQPQSCHSFHSGRSINNSYANDIQQNRTQQYNFVQGQRQHDLFQSDQIQRSSNNNGTGLTGSSSLGMSTLSNSQQIRHQYVQEEYNVDQDLHQNKVRTSSNNSFVPFYSVPNNQKYCSRQSDHEEYSLQGNMQQQRINSNQSYSAPVQETIFRQTSNCLPLVGSTCTVVTTSPPPMENEIDIYDFPTENEDTVANSLITPYASKISIPLPSTSMTSTTFHPTQRHVALNTGLEEEDDEDDCEPVFKNSTDQLKVPSNLTDAENTGANQAINSLNVSGPAVVSVKKSRKQQLPSSSKESSVITIKTPPLSKYVKEKITKSQPKKDESARTLAVYVYKLLNFLCYLNL